MPQTLHGMLNAHNLTKQFSHRAKAVDDVSFALEPGTVTGFLGPNGAGKSTVLRMLCGLVRPTSGYATVAGVEYSDLDNPAATVGAMLDATAVHPARSARNHLRVMAWACGVDRGRVDQVLDLVELGRADARRRIGGYSMGMRQRLGLATALLADPPILILDEPATGLDPDGIVWLRRLARDRADQGGTVLLSSHLLGEVARIADRILMISDGRLVADAPIDEIQSAGSTLEDRFMAITSKGGRS